MNERAWASGIIVVRRRKMILVRGVMSLKARV